MGPLIEPTIPIGAASIALVRHSFARVQPAAQLAASRFYAHLFEAHPELRPLFKGDLQAQGAKLMEMLATAIDLLTRPWGLAPVLRRLGERHAGYGVQPGHYRAVGTALIKALQDTLGPEFGPEERRAWGHVYGRISEAMQMAAASSALLATTREACNPMPPREQSA